MTAAPDRPATPPRSGLPLATRLMIAQAVVLVVGVGAAALVASLVGPPLFHRHLLEAGHNPSPTELAHTEQAYASANTASLTVALVIALACAIAVTWYAARRITRPLHALAGVAEELFSAGDYGVRAPRTGGGPSWTGWPPPSTTSRTGCRPPRTPAGGCCRTWPTMRPPGRPSGARLEGLKDEVIAWTPETAQVLREQAGRLERLADDLSEVSRAEENRLDLHPVPTEAADLIRTAAQAWSEAYRDRGVRLVDPTRLSHAGDATAAWSLRSTGTASSRCWPTSSPTRCATRPPGGRSASARAGWGTPSASRSPTPATASTPPSSAHVFERFYRGDMARAHDLGGSGIGLTIARSIALAHGGHLDGHSVGAGQGSTFVLSLPLARP